MTTRPNSIRPNHWWDRSLASRLRNLDDDERGSPWPGDDEDRRLDLAECMDEDARRAFGVRYVPIERSHVPTLPGAGHIFYNEWPGGWSR